MHTEVFEHVPDDLVGFRELYRVLRSGGHMLFSVPLTNLTSTFKAEYAVYSGDVPYGPASELLKGLAQDCPRALDPILKPPNQKGFILYKVDLKALASESCQ